MRSVNESKLSGTVTRDFEIHTFQSGSRIARGEIAVSRGSAADFPIIKAWGNVGDALQSYAKKGAFLFLEGELRTELYPDPQDAAKQRKLKQSYVLARYVKVVDASTGDTLAEAKDEGRPANAPAEEELAGV